MVRTPMEDTGHIDPTKIIERGEQVRSTMSKRLRKQLRLIERFRELDAEMQAQTVAIFLYIANSPVPVKMQDIADDLGLAQSSVSRNVAALSDWTRHRKKGHNLVEAFEDPMERRRKLVRLTTKGKRFTTSLLDILD